MQAYPAGYAQPNKGTLVPGQSITVNKYTVVVERYLSQGGFAHVYLVRTAQPVYNTTHHVLKRIAVPNEAMLSEVKKEVDIMRILKGHPNIVFLIDAAWHRMANGTYEVFILMEFCPGGGIIDMMNRRLRERLTEHEILTIFVEVCEGLAAMHALKPPILHRDLKVENILQSSATSYKLCDFGSATPVQKIPSNTQELRLLEADLNKHTTLQYRAPEMIDVHLRRPIDEKSDVWALGVLLYKLCYYTTPFEEHGPLAILNVQYKIPPYPVYSMQMNSLIGSMLKEHGAQRPSVFEILQHVHGLRGTKSRFTYNIPAKEPLSPRSLQPPLQTLSPNVAANPLDDLVAYRSSAAKNAGVEAREKVLEAIAPMRRGRPQGQAPGKPTSRNTSPDKPVAFETKFGDEDDRAWKGLRAARSGLPFSGGDSASLNSKADVDAWSVGSRGSAQPSDSSARRGFENDFSSGFGSKFASRPSAPSKPLDSSPSGFGTGFGDSFNPANGAPASSSPPSASRPGPTPQQPSRLRQSRIMGKDAFDGLGFSSQPQAPTLGEARMSRTGLASFGSSSSSSLPTSQPTPGSLGTSNTTYHPPNIHASRPTPSPQLPQSQIQPQSSSLSPIPPPSQSWRQNVKAPSPSQDGMSAEERFPSLEDLDKTFGSPSPDNAANARPPPMPSRPADRPPSRSGYMGASSATTGHDGMPGAKGRFDGARSQQVTGTAMREARPAGTRHSTFLRKVDSAPTKTDDGPSAPHAHVQPIASRPSLSRKHRSSVTMKATPQSRNDSVDLLGSVGTPSLPPRPSAAKAEPQDWLTGGDEGMGGPLGIRTTGLGAPSDAQPVLRDSPSKRASYVERSPISLAKPLEAESGVALPAAQVAASASQATMLEREWDIALDRLDNIPAGKGEREKRMAEKKPPRDGRRRSKSPGSTRAFITRNDVSTDGLGLNLPSGTGAIPRQPSPGLTDNWSPVVPQGSRPKQGSGSSSDDGPEDLGGYRPGGGTAEKTRELQKVTSKAGGPLNGTGSGDGQRRRRTRSKGRQSSVHDLVDLWGGAKSPTLPPPNKRSSVIVTSNSMKPPPLTNNPRSSSPQPMPPPSPRKSKPPTSQQGSRQLPAPPLGAEPSSGRSRPASMFIAPITTTRSNAADLGVASSSEAAATLAQQALSPPDTPRSRRSVRRSSISDMVHHYEAIGTTFAPRSGGPGPGPSAPAKPAALKMHKSTPSNASSFDYAAASPSAAATRFPKLSPSSSPVLPKANLAVPEDSARDRDLSRFRTSPTGLPPRSSPVGRFEMPFGAANAGAGSNAHPTGASINGLPARRSPLPLEVAREQQPSRASVKATVGMIAADMQPPPSPRMERKVSGQLEPPAQNPNVRSPSPEKPYQGVSKLIDRWQRVADETGPPARRGGAPLKKPAGIVSGGAGRP